MDSEAAKYILAIAEHRSISKAADALFISQPKHRCTRGTNKIK